MIEGPIGPQAVIRGRQVSKVESKAPGPGQYDQQAALKSPLWSFAKGTKGLKFARKGSPGPGQYSPREGEKALYGKFAASDRAKSPTMEGPGPGAYQLPSTNANLAFSLTSRHKVISKEQRPGPGAYNPPGPSSSSAFRMGSSPRALPRPASELPGPGAYDPKSTASLAAL